MCSEMLKERGMTQRWEDQRKLTEEGAVDLDIDGRVPFGWIEMQKDISREGNLTKSRKCLGMGWHYLVVLEGK